MPAQVLDSFALLAYLRDEPGAETIEALLGKASRRDSDLHMTEVNYAEVKYIILRKDGDRAWRDVREALASLPVQFHPATRELADRAADFKALHTLSLADAFAAALAKERGWELVTGDPEFAQLGGEIRIRWLSEAR